MPGCGIGEDRLVGLEHALEAGKAFLGDGAELGAGEVDRATIHRPQYAVRDVGRTGIDEEMVPSTNRHTDLQLHPIVFQPASDMRPSRSALLKREKAGCRPAFSSRRYSPNLGRCACSADFLQCRPYATARPRSRHF